MEKAEFLEHNFIWEGCIYFILHFFFIISQSDSQVSRNALGVTFMRTYISQTAHTNSAISSFFYVFYLQWQPTMQSRTLSTQLKPTNYLLLIIPLLSLYTFLFVLSLIQTLFALFSLTFPTPIVPLILLYAYPIGFVPPLLLILFFIFHGRNRETHETI